MTLRQQHDDNDNVDPNVTTYLDTLDPATRAEADTLDALMQRVSNERPRLENAGTLAYGTYHYRYDSGREGDALVIGFYPRKGKTTVYLMDGTARYADQLAHLGAHTLTGYCLYLKRLSDVDATVLEQVVAASWAHITDEAANGPIDRILWKD